MAPSEVGVPSETKLTIPSGRVLWWVMPYSQLTVAGQNCIFWNLPWGVPGITFHLAPSLFGRRIPFLRGMWTNSSVNLSESTGHVWIWILLGRWQPLVLDQGRRRKRCCALFSSLCHASGFSMSRSLPAWELWEFLVKSFWVSEADWHQGGSQITQGHNGDCGCHCQHLSEAGPPGPLWGAVHL